MQAFHTVLCLSEHLQHFRICPVDELERLILNLSLYDRLPLSFLELLNKDNGDCFLFICYSVTNSVGVRLSEVTPRGYVPGFVTSGIRSCM